MEGVGECYGPLLASVSRTEEGRREGGDVRMVGRMEEERELGGVELKGQINQWETEAKCERAVEICHSRVQETSGNNRRQKWG